METSEQQPGIKYAVLLLIIGVVLRFFTNIVGGGIIGFFVGFKMQAAGAAQQEVASAAKKVVQNNLQYLSLLGVILSSVVLIWMGLRKRQKKLKELVIKNKEKINLKLLVIIAVPAVSLALFSSEILELLMNLLRTSTSALENMNRILQGGVGLIIGLVLAPVLEEIIFRGIILAGIAAHHSRKKALITSALLFSVYHLNLFQLIPSFLLGLLLGYIYLETRSVLICIYTHFMYNLIPMISNQFQATTGQVPQIEKIDYVIIGGSLLAVLGGVKLLWDYFQTNHNVQAVTGSEK